MKDRYDFSKGKRGKVVPPEPEPERQDTNYHSAGPGYCGSLFSNGRRIWGHNRVSNPHQRGVTRVSRRESAEVRGYPTTHHSRGVEVQCRLSGGSSKARHSPDTIPWRPQSRYANSFEAIRMRQ